MNAKQYLSELIKKLIPDHGETESIALSRVIQDHLIRITKAPADNDSKWPEPIIQRFDAIQKGLLEGIPIQYILNESWFDGRCFFVDPSVLIPRPETEELLDWIRKDVAPPTAPLQILDIGTGSGILAVSLKRAFKNAVVRAIDVSESALNIAQSNATRFEAEIAFQQIDFTDKKNWSAIEPVDILVSNPPYIGLEEKNTLPKNVLEQEPWLALFVEGDDPLLFYRLIAEFGDNKLKPSGRIFVEIHEDRAVETIDVFESAGYDTSVRTDMQGKYRMIRAIKR